MTLNYDMFIKVAGLVMKLLILIFVIAIFDKVSKMTQAKEKFSYEKKQHEDCVKSFLDGKEDVQGSDLTSLEQAHLQCSSLVNYTSESPCFQHIHAY